MKRLIILLFLFLVALVPVEAQTRYGFVDMEYILSHIPEYGKAQEELKAYVAKLQGELDGLYQEITEMQNKYNAEKVFLTPVMRERKEKEIAEKENKARLLQENYFGPRGELFRKREELMRPIEEEIKNVIDDIAKEQNLGLILDISGDRSIMYYDPKQDKSATVLRKMGYSPGRKEGTDSKD